MNPRRQTSEKLKGVSKVRKSTSMERPGRGAPPKPKNVMKAAREKRDINKKMRNGREQHTNRSHL